MTARRLIAFVLAVLAGIGLSVILLYGSICSVAFRPQEYVYVQRLCQVNEPEMEERDAELAEYLREKGSLSGPWTEQEILHMRDVLNLFLFGEKLCIWSIGCTSLLFLLASCLYRSIWKAFQTIPIGFAVVWGGLVLCAAWAATDFSQWFTWMHKMVFSNDLWIFDASESTLIRLLPQEFFEKMVFEIFFRFAAASGVIVLVSRIGIGNRLKNNTYETEKAKASVQ